MDPISIVRTSLAPPGSPGLSVVKLLFASKNLMLSDNDMIEIDTDYISNLRIVSSNQLQSYLGVELETHGFCVVDVGIESLEVLAAAEREATCFFDADDDIKTSSRKLIYESGILFETGAL